MKICETLGHPDSLVLGLNSKVESSLLDPFREEVRQGHTLLACRPACRQRLGAQMGPNLASGPCLIS